MKKDKAVVEIDNSNKWEPSKKLPTSKEEVVVDDKKSSSEKKAGEATDDEDMGVSTDSEEENVGEGEDFVLEEVSKLPTSEEEVVVDDKKSSYEKKAGLATDIKSVEIPSVLPFFVNGCFAPGIDIYFLHEASYI